MERGDDARQSVREPLGDVRFARQAGSEWQAFDGRTKLGHDAGFVTAWVNAIPAVTAKMNGDQAMEEKCTARVICSEPLIAKRRGNAT